MTMPAELRPFRRRQPELATEAAVAASVIDLTSACQKRGLIPDPTHCACDGSGSLESTACGSLTNLVFSCCGWGPIRWVEPRSSQFPRHLRGTDAGTRIEPPAILGTRTSGSGEEEFGNAEGVSSPSIFRAPNLM